MPAQIPPSLIERDSDSQVYWEGIEQGELRIQRCSSCSRAIFYPRSICPHCHADQLTWIVASGQGTIYSYTIVHQAFGPFADEVPYAVAIVELVEGVRMMTQIINAPRERITIGAAVHVSFESTGQGDDRITLPYFRLSK